MLSGDSRCDCYASFGMDAERVDEYLGRTLCLEAALQGARTRTLLTQRLHALCITHVPPAALTRRLCRAR